MITKAKFDIDIQKYLIEKQNIINKKLNEIFDNNKELHNPPELWNAVKYSLLEGGKRIRGILCLATYESLKNDDQDFLDDCLTVASTIEIIHAMSLIHDDLPSMDNDDLRRGKPSCHKAFSEATAILAGDAMLTLPFYLITEKCPNLSNEQKINIFKILSKATTFGLVPGQILDLSIIKKECDLKTLETIYALKTAELISASITCGTVVAINNIPKYEDNEIIKHLSTFGIKAGIAFQIIDDILDITSDTKTLGKTSGKDERLQKPTYPMLIGIDNSRKAATDLVLQANHEIKNLPFKNSILQSVANFILNRIN